MTDHIECCLSFHSVSCPVLAGAGKWASIRCTASGVIGQPELRDNCNAPTMSHFVAIGSISSHGFPSSVQACAPRHQPRRTNHDGRCGTLVVSIVGVPVSFSDFAPHDFDVWRCIDAHATFSIFTSIDQHPDIVADLNRFAVLSSQHQHRSTFRAKENPLTICDGSAGNCLRHRAATSIRQGIGS